MADVRSLLRNERASRRINHPYATYTPSGTLVCRVCQIQLKSESLWDMHSKSVQHAMQLQKAKEGTIRRPHGNLNLDESFDGTKTGKKRKANYEDDDVRKRSKAASGVPDGFIDGGDRRLEPEATANTTTNSASLQLRKENTVRESLIEDDTNAPAHIFPDTLPPSKPSSSASPPPGFSDASTIITPRPTNTVDEDEWAAFERDLATLPLESSGPSALTAAATISAAPLSAEEIAARAREEASTQAKERREAELEGDKEDAARQLEEEFDEMELLEERVRRLREKREELRRKGDREEEDYRIGVKDDDVGNEEEDDDDNDDLLHEEANDWDSWGI